MKKILASIMSSVLLATASGLTVSAADSGYTFRYTVDNREITITGASGNSSILSIPEKIDGLPVTEIADNIFAGNTVISSVTLPDSLKVIGEKAFSNCSKLNDVYIGSGTVSIDEQAFSACPVLKSISVSSDNKTYHSESGSLYKGDMLFIYAGKNDAVIADDTTSIDRYAFFGKTELTSAEIPDSVTTIGDYAFSGCLALNDITLPDTVTSIGTYCFLSCTSLSAVQLSSSLNTIPKGCFHGCTSLYNISIPDSVTVIEDHAFYSCDSLTSMYIPPSVTSIGTDALGRKYSIRTDKDENIRLFSLSGKAGSAAEKYASEMNMIFTERNSPSSEIGNDILLGDVNLDYVVDGKDASMTLREYALLSAGGDSSFTEKQLLAADFNCDRVIDAKDASDILTYYALISVSNN